MKIKQIMPANGYVAVFAGGGKPFTQELLCFALFKPSKNDCWQVAGMIIDNYDGGTIMPVEEERGFLGYEPSEDAFDDGIEEWQARAKFWMTENEHRWKNNHDNEEDNADG